jgi:DNA/RNA-binding domain of Phe-tRNA-synthetase-like protein
MTEPPFAVRLELEGWELVWCRLQAEDDPGDSLGALREEVARRVRALFGWAGGEGGNGGGQSGGIDLGRLAEHRTVAALRALFRAAGCDPTRYRPSSEALLRRVLRGEALPAIHPFVDINNCLSVELKVPSCVLAEGTIAGDVTLRAGREGETFESLRGPFNLAGKPLLADARGPFSTPITDSERVKVGEGTREAWMIAYLPAGVVAAEAARRRLEELLAAAPVARLG